jgi:tRNA pseudouridine55 synthase
MNNILVLNKQIGQTPLESIQKYKTQNPEYADLPMTYAGRLDPMAEGILLVLVGEECKKKNDYLALDKTYEATILFNIATDSLDLLGIPTLSDKQTKLNKETAQTLIASLPGTHTLPLPAYSSVPVQGKALHQWMRDGAIDTIQIPKREMVIKDVKLLAVGELGVKELLQETQSRIIKVRGDFRQQEIMNTWKSVLEDTNQHFPTLTVELSVTSGTYIRALASMVGNQLGTQACLFSLRRTQIGNYCIE